MEPLKTYVAASLADGVTHTVEDVQESVKRNLLSTIAHMNCGPFEATWLSVLYFYRTGRRSIQRELDRLAHEGRAQQVPPGRILPPWRRKIHNGYAWRLA